MNGAKGADEAKIHLIVVVSGCHHQCVKCKQELKIV